MSTFPGSDCDMSNHLSENLIFRKFLWALKAQEKSKNRLN